MSETAANVGIAANSDLVVNTGIIAKSEDVFFCKWSTEVTYKLGIDYWWERLGATANTHFIWLDFDLINVNLSCNYRDDTLVKWLANRVRIMIAPLNTVIDVLEPWPSASTEIAHICCMSDNLLDSPNFSTIVQNKVIAWTIKSENIVHILNDEIMYHELKYFNNFKHIKLALKEIPNVDPSSKLRWQLLEHPTNSANAKTTDNVKRHFYTYSKTSKLPAFPSLL